MTRRPLVPALPEHALDDAEISLPTFRPLQSSGLLTWLINTLADARRTVHLNTWLVVGDPESSSRVRQQAVQLLVASPELDTPETLRGVFHCSAGREDQAQTLTLERGILSTVQRELHSDPRQILTGAPGQQLSLRLPSVSGAPARTVRAAGDAALLTLLGLDAQISWPFQLDEPGALFSDWVQHRDTFRIISRSRLHAVYARYVQGHPGAVRSLSRPNDVAGELLRNLVTVHTITGRSDWPSLGLERVE